MLKHALSILSFTVLSFSQTVTFSPQGAAVLKNQTAYAWMKKTDFKGEF